MLETQHFTSRPYWYKATLDDVGFTPAEAEVFYLF